MASTLARASNGEPMQKRQRTSASSSPQGGAMTRVFATTELLEMILLQLSNKEILLCQRVSREWKNTYKSSTQLKDKILERVPIASTASLQPPCLINPLLFAPLRESLNFAYLNFGPWTPEWTNMYPNAIGISLQPGRTPRLHVQFTRQQEIPFPKRQELSPGSWDGLYMTSPAYKTSLMVQHLTAKTKPAGTGTGRIFVGNIAKLFVDLPALPIGPIMDSAQQLDDFLTDNVWNLPKHSEDFLSLCEAAPPDIQGESRVRLALVTSEQKWDAAEWGITEEEDDND